MSYLVGEGFRNVLKNKKSTSAALTIMCMAMFMFGIFFILGENINYVMTQVESEQGMQVFMKDDATEEDIKKAEREIRAISGVNTLEYISKTDAMNAYKESFGERKGVLDGLDEVLPASFVVTLTDLSLNSSVQEQILKINQVDEINSSNGTIEMLMSITKGIRMVTLVILVILVFISIFIITNTIKLTVHARRKEISIMKYVGATNGFIRWPFVVEGIIIGLISAMITILIVGAIYNFATEGMMQTSTFKTLGLKLYTFSDMFQLLITTYVILGAGIGIVRKFNINEKILRSIRRIKL